MGATDNTSGTDGCIGGDVEGCAALTMAELQLPSRRARRVRSRALAAVALAGGLLLQAPSRPSETFDQCVKRRTAAGETEAVAKTACVTSTPSTTPGSNGGGSLTATTADKGTSTVTLLLIGLGGVAVGAVGATALRRKQSPAAQPVGAGAPTGNPAAHMPPPAAAPAPVAAPSANDRSPGLVTALIELADRVPSQALRAEILAALGRAGVHTIEPAQGEVFDVSRMRGVGNAPTPDAGWVGRVASTDRVGFHDGVSVLRVPEVVVYTAGA
ncbi:MAG: hypothetical protein ABMA25_04505 [Ilumatobacteraceae bacterium]